jgi:GT2 family glycosyltransferase
VSERAVSVIVPTADRPRALRRCLDALAAVDYPSGRLEVIVVDDASRTDLRPVYSALPDDLRVRVVRHERRNGPAAARTTGAGLADGELLAFTDDDCVPARDWLQALTATLAEAPGSAVGGLTVNALRENRFAAASQHIQDLVYAHYNRDPAAAWFLASNNLGVPRADFLAVGGFDAARFPFASEDRDFCDRWRASGRALRFAEAAVVRHANDLQLRSFVCQHVAYGRGAARYHRARAERGTGRLIDETTFHLDRSLWLRTLRLRPAGGLASTVALLALWQVANTAGYALERARIGGTPERRERRAVAAIAVAPARRG